MKQTAVEWLVEKLEQNKFITKSQIYIAEEMEKKQIMNAYIEGDVNGIMDNEIRAEQYYNETFKNE